MKPGRGATTSRGGGGGACMGYGRQPPCGGGAPAGGGAGPPPRRAHAPPRRPPPRGRRGGGVGGEVEAHEVLLPLDGVDGKVVGEDGAAVGQRVVARERMRTRVAWPVEAAEVRERLRATHLHDVDLAALGPRRGTEVVPQRPE